MMSHPWHGERGIGGVGIVGILVAVAILLYLAVQMVPRYTGAGLGGAAKAPPGKAATPIQRAESVECRTNLLQIRQAITMYQSSNERRPASLAELRTSGVAQSMLACPVGGARYIYGYDPRTGRVGCRYPGHERY